MFSALALGLQMGLTTAMPMPAALVALDRHPQFELDRYTRQIEHAGGWWVELENRLLVAAPPSRLPGLLAGERVLSDLGWIRPDDLALQTRACGVDEGRSLPAIADTGRLASLDIVDSFGQRSAIRFKGMQVNPALPASTFQFKPPAGADIVKQ